jgi:hypothetical protein
LWTVVFYLQKKGTVHTMKYIARDMVDILLYESSNTKLWTRKGIYHTQAYRRKKIRDRKKTVRVFGIFAQLIKTFSVQNFRNFC